MLVVANLNDQENRHDLSVGNTKIRIYNHLTNISTNRKKKIIIITKFHYSSIWVGWTPALKLQISS